MLTCAFSCHAQSFLGNNHFLHFRPCIYLQGLSQFNLPVSLPSVHLLGTPAGTGPLPSVSASSTTLTNSKGFHSKNSKPGLVDDGLGFNGAFSGSGCVGGADLYDPDQPLWNNNCTDTSNGQRALQSPKNYETDSVLNDDPSDRHNGRSCDIADNECLVRSTGTAVGLQGTGTSVWGRIGGSKNRLDMKAKIDSAIGSADCFENEAKEDKGALASVQGTSRQGKWIVAEDVGPKATASSPKRLSDSARNIRKPSQKALRTLFVNGIPPKINKREGLLSHFQKFGEVIDIYIPVNGERAFVQFSKREDAETALKAPDAVMGNRFIKLWWAKRDSIPDDGISSGGVSVTPRGVTAASVPYLPFPNSGKDINQSDASKSSVLHASDASVPVSDHPKPVIPDGPKAPPLQKKLESLEYLKEELRKKQEMLDQKRNDFRRQLQKLEEQVKPNALPSEFHFWLHILFMLHALNVGIYLVISINFQKIEVSVSVVRPILLPLTYPTMHMHFFTFTNRKHITVLCYLDSLQLTFCRLQDLRVR